MTYLNAKFKKAVACGLAAVMILSAVFCIRPEQARAASGSLTATKGVYWFDPHLAGIDLTDNYIYDDELLKGDSLKLSWPLATMTYELAVSSISSEREPKTDAGYANKSRNIRAYLEDNGFVDFDTNEDYKKKMTTRTMGVACAHKKIKDGGKDYTVLVIVPRSAGYEAEWGGNFMLGTTGDHEGFRIGKDKVLSFAKEYVKKYGIKGNIKVWTAGYSRGAGVTNQVGAALLRDPKEALGDAVTLKPGDFYCYTYGTPNSAGTDSEDYEDSKFDYIHNLWQPYDITTVVPFEVLGFSRYGKNFTYADKGDKDRMLRLCKDLNKLVYDAYTTEGDPEVFFKPKKLDVDALVTKRELKFVDDNDSYLPSTQKDFAELLAETAGVAFGTREVYVEGYQDAIEELGGYYYSHLEVGDKLAEGIMGSKLAIPTVIAAYIAYMAERYKENTVSADDKEALEQWIAELETIIEEIQESGAEVPQEILDKVDELKDALRRAERLEDLVEIAWVLTGLCCSYTLGDGLTNAGLPEEDKELYDRMTSVAYCRAYAHVAAYFMLYDSKQTEGITFSYLSQQFKHLATLIGNAGSYQRPHNNEIILSWLRTIDHSYDDFKKETAAQIAGYRRVYIKQPKGVTVTGIVKDGSGKTVAKFRNGRITSRTDKWVGITTCDNGNWLRLPIDKTYNVEISTNRKAKLNIKVTEYSVYDGKEVRTVKKDANYDWSKLVVKPENKTTLVVSKVAKAGGKYKLKSNAKYYIDIVKPVLTAKAVCKGDTAATLSWNKIPKAQRYSVYFIPCSKDKAPVKIRTLKAGRLSFVKKGLKKGIIYKFRIKAERKENGKYRTMCSSMTGHFVAGNLAVRRTNAKSMTVNKSKVEVKAGKTFRIKATAKPVLKGKKFLRTIHAPLYRYVSNDTGVAAVTKKGVIKAKRKGTCKVYVVTINGISKAVNVTVK